MAQRRCFRNSIFEDDKFAELTDKAKLIYFAANLKADDDGFFNSVRGVLNQIDGATKEHFKEIVEAGYIHDFKDGVYCLMDWHKNNSIPKDRYHPTPYQNHFKELALVEESYILYTECNQDVNNLYTQSNLSQSNSSKVNLNQSNPIQVNLKKERENQSNPSQTNSSEENQTQDKEIDTPSFFPRNSDRPTYSEFIAYCNEIGMPKHTAKEKFDWLENTDWKSKGRPIENWKAYCKMIQKNEP